MGVINLDVILPLIGIAVLLVIFLVANLIDRRERALMTEAARRARDKEKRYQSGIW